MRGTAHACGRYSHAQCPPARAHPLARKPSSARNPTQHPISSRRCIVTAAHQYDVVGLGNLCVDVISPVDSLPRGPKTRSMLDELYAAPLDETSWEVGGSCNFLIAAARMGLKTASVGHAGLDVYGDFMSKVLQEEGITALERIAPRDGSSSLSPEEAELLKNTLICFVLVDALGRHSFCSLYDFGPWPLLRGIHQLPKQAMELVESARVVFVNGFIFDELTLEVVQGACFEAIKKGGAVFFDPGPRCFTMMEGSRREALDAILQLSAVVLMTEEEAAVITGQQHAEAAARAVLGRPNAYTQWCIVKLGAKGALMAAKDPSGAVAIYQASAFKVAVSDTVGCGDSFASAIVLGFTSQLPIPLTLALANAVGAATAMGRGAGRSVASAQQVRALLLRSLGQLDQQQPYPEGVLRQAISIVQARLDDAGSSPRVTQFN